MSDTTESTALALIPPSALPTILAADGDDILGALRKKLAGYAPDATTQGGRDEIGSKAKMVGSAKQDLLRLGAGLKADHQKALKAIIAEERIIEERMDAMRDAILAPRVAYQEREKNRVAAHEAAIEEIRAWTAVPMDSTSAQVRTRWEHCRQHLHQERDWQEFEARARYEIQAAEATLERLYQRLAKEEAEAAELARLRADEAARQAAAAERLRIEREAEIARQAAERARQQAEADAARRLQAAQEEAARKLREAEERAEAERLAVERRGQEAAAEAERVLRAERERAAEEAAQVERDRQAEEQRAAHALAEAEAKAEAERHAAAERERLAAQRAADEARQAAEREAAQARRAEAAEAQAKAAREQAERDAAAAVERERQRVAAETAKAEAEAKAREADKAHKTTVNREAAAAFVAAGLDDKMARTAVMAIALGKIPHCRISY